MHWIDYLIFAIYFGGVLSIGIYFYLKNVNKEDYYVGGRNVSAGHVGLSVVATDVGGGFSIGLGGLGFMMGLSGSWLLFAGLVGAWMAAVLIIPKIKSLDTKHGMLTYPDFLKYAYNRRVAAIAALISGIGYMGFTSAQILAGAKLAAGSLFINIDFMTPLDFSLYIMTAIIIIYTVLGGIKAVIYTDTIQWIILLGGLFFLGLPFAYNYIGGWEAIDKGLPEGFLTLTNIEPIQFINWMGTILPIWFIAMTLYQRIYACRNEKEAKKAFFIAGVFEYPIMAFIGVTLGMLGRVVFPEADAEMALPRLLKEVLPIGIAGFVLASYFSAIMSTADSCLIASSGNFVSDLIEAGMKNKRSEAFGMRLSQWVTLTVGALALIIAGAFQTVLEIILHAYAFMVSGLLAPTIAAYFLKKPDSNAALISMLGGGGLTIFLIAFKTEIFWGLDPSIPGILFSTLLYAIVYNLKTKKSYV